MVLAAMLKESVMKKAREEGRREAQKEIRERRLKRWNEAFDRFVVEVNGVVMLPWTPEVERFLAGESEA